MRFIKEQINNTMNSSKTPLNDIDRRLIELYGEEQCMILKKEDPDTLKYRSFVISSGFLISDQKELTEDGIVLEILESLDPVNFPEDEPELIVLGVFNPMRYNIKRSMHNRKHYTIGNTGKVLMLYSEIELKRMYAALVA